MDNHIVRYMYIYIYVNVCLYGVCVHLFPHPFKMVTEVCLFLLKEKNKNKKKQIIPGHSTAGETYCVVGEQLLAFHMLHAQQHLGPEHMRTKDLPVVEVEVYAQPTHGTVVELRSSPLKNPN
jgi:hypothetical protein